MVNTRVISSGKNIVYTIANSSEQTLILVGAARNALLQLASDFSGKPPATFNGYVVARKCRNGRAFKYLKGQYKPS